MQYAGMQEPHERLAWARRNAGYETATDAAKAMGVYAPTYLGHENGSRGLGRNLQKYSKFFKVSAVWLLTGEGPALFRDMVDPTADLPPEKRAEALRFIEFLRASTGR